VRKNKFYILNFLFFILLILTISNCSNTTEVPKGNLTGVVHLEGQSDHSGIIVAVYELAYLDTTIVRINNEYPHIGVIINQHTEFDHRFQSPVKFTETDIEGNFLIKKIPVGEYNIIALKDSFGFKYIYEFDIEKGDNELTPQPPLFNLIEGELKGVYSSLRTDADITLYEEQSLSGDITDDWIFEIDHHYIIGEEGANSTIFVYGTNLEIQPGAIIRIEPENDLKIQGTISAQGEEDNMFWFTSDEGFGEAVEQNYIDSTNYYNNFELLPYSIVTDDIIEWGKFDLANIGLLNKANNLHLQNGIFRDSQCGFYSIAIDSAFCSNVLCKTISNEEQAGIYYLQAADGLIEKNIVNNCENGIKIKNESSPEIKNNYIYDCNVGIHHSYYSFPTVHNNEIYECGTGIYILRSYYHNIEKNIIKANYGVICESYYNPIEIHYNNFNCNTYAIKIISHASVLAVDIYAENNYYYTTNEEEIQELIYDKNDVTEPEQFYTGIVIYYPFLHEQCSYAGIQGE